MSRQLNGHKVNPANDVIDITVVDEPGSGGANHSYLLSGANLLSNPSHPKHGRYLNAKQYLDENPNPNPEIALHFRHTVNKKDDLLLLFQNGPIPEAGVNGITHEALLEVLIDRLNGFQSGPFACQANADCLNHLKAAQEILLNRTRERMARGVEGSHKA